MGGCGGVTVLEKRATLTLHLNNASCYVGVPLHLPTLLWLTGGGGGGSGVIVEKKVEKILLEKGARGGGGDFPLRPMAHSTHFVLARSSTRLLDWRRGLGCIDGTCH